MPIFLGFKLIRKGSSARAAREPEQGLAPEWLRKLWSTTKEAGLDRLSMDEIEAETAAARKARREVKSQPGA